MLIPKFKTTFMGKDITLPEVFLLSSFVPIYWEALNSPKFAEKIKTGNYGLCYAIKDVSRNVPASDSFTLCMVRAIGTLAFLEDYVMEALSIPHVDATGMIDLRLAWAKHIAKHIGIHFQSFPHKADIPKG